MPCRERRLLIGTIFCLSMLILLTRLQAYEYAEILIPNLDDWWMQPLDTGENDGPDELCRWWGYEGEAMWACPRCGARDNIAWIGRCIGCGYARSNPEGYLLRPVEAERITNGYSGSHRAIDFGAAEGTPVFAAEDGIVTKVLENDRWEGIVLRIRHGDGMETLYAHLQEALAPVGRCVRRGEVIALSGNTGASTGPHLHFEVYQGSEADDPLYYLQP